VFKAIQAFRGIRVFRGTQVFKEILDLMDFKVTLGSRAILV
jgi:hypothetical protein